MTAARQKKEAKNADQPQTPVIPGLEGLPEIPTLGADDAGGVRADAGGQEGGQGGAGQDQQAAPSKPPVKAAKKELTKLELVLKHYPHDFVGGRHLAVIDGQHVWLTNTHPELGHELTYHGEQLAEALLKD